MKNNMKILEDTDLIAGEYVLGTLEAEEREALEDRASVDPDIAALIAAWEWRLAPLHELVVPVKPPEDVWPRIERRLGHVEQDERPRGPAFVELVREIGRRHGADSAHRLVSRLRYWRAAAVLAGMAAVTLAGFLAVELVRPALAPPAPAILVGVLRSEAPVAPVVVVLDPKGGTLAVRSVPSNTADDRAYVFWLLRDGGAPMRLGSLRGTGVLGPEGLAAIEAATLRKAGIGVTVEPNEAKGEEPGGPFVYRGALE